MGTRTSTSRRVFRQRLPLALGVACGLTGLLLLVPIVRSWAENPEPLFAAWVLFALALVWALFVRPAVLLGDDGVTIRNIVRDIHIPWAQVTRVDTRWNLKVYVQDRGYTAWAIASQVERPRLSSLRPSAQSGRTEQHLGADARSSTSEPKVTAAVVARAIESARNDHAEAVARGALTAAPDGQVRVTWVRLVLAILALSGLAVVTLSLT